jgi:hypothetical protein
VWGVLESLIRRLTFVFLDLSPITTSDSCIWSAKPPRNLVVSSSLDRMSLLIMEISDLLTLSGERCTACMISKVYVDRQR